jgi:hypothetical protein
MVSPGCQIYFAAASAKVRHGIGPTLVACMVGKGPRIVAGGASLQTMKQNQQGLFLAL